MGATAELFAGSRDHAGGDERGDRAIMDGIVLSDASGRVVLINATAEALLGIKAFQALGKQMAALGGHSELQLALAIGIQGLVDDDQPHVQVVELHHSQRDLMFVRVATSIVLDHASHPSGHMAVIQDVTEVHKSDELKNRYLSIVAHELRTPLTGIKTFSTLMAKGRLGPLTDRQREVAESIREQSLRLEHQIDKLVNLGQIDKAEYGRDRETFPVADFAATLLGPFEQAARDRSIQLGMVVEVEGGLLLHADRTDLRRACQALVENAIKFTGEGGSVEVSIRRNADGSVRLGVRDTGIGIDSRYHRRIFEKFFQVEDPLTRHHGGAGLGLFVAQGIVRSHGSSIQVSSKLGAGADFSFTLPLAAPAAGGSGERPD